MKSTQHWFVPTVTVVTMIITMPASFVATDGKKGVLEVEMARKDEGGIEAVRNVTTLPKLVIITRLADGEHRGGEQAGAESSLSGTDEPVDPVSIGNRVSRWLWIGVHVVAAACVLFSGHVTLNM